MKNPIIAELRRIRDAHADLEPWMQKHAYILRGWQNGPHGFAEPRLVAEEAFEPAKREVKVELVGSPLEPGEPA